MGKLEKLEKMEKMGEGFEKKFKKKLLKYYQEPSASETYTDESQNGKAIAFTSIIHKDFFNDFDDDLDDEKI